MSTAPNNKMKTGKKRNVLQFLSSSIPQFAFASLLMLAACASSNNFEPRDKTAQYDPTTGELTMPYPCPDWSQTQTTNYQNQIHSNYGCAENTDSALQIAEPSDLYRGHGTVGPDTEITTGIITQYRAGKIPVPLIPMQDTSTGSPSGGSQ